MAKFEEVFKDTEEIFRTVISNADLERVLHIKILANNKLKEIGKVVKATDLLKHMTGEDVIILINEEVFEALNDTELQTMVAEELVTYIGYDYENDKLNIAKPDIKTFSGVLRKHGWEKYETLHESIKSIYNQAKEEEAEATV